jgi:hypothetical protein
MYSLIHLKLRKSEVARRLDDESFRITKNTEKTLFLELYAGYNGEGNVCTWVGSITGHVHEGKMIKILEYEDVRSLEFESKLRGRSIVIKYNKFVYRFNMYVLFL